MKKEYKVSGAAIGLGLSVFILACTVYCFVIALIIDNQIAAWGWGLLTLHTFGGFLKSMLKYLKKKHKRKLKECSKEDIYTR